MKELAAWCARLRDRPAFERFIIGTIVVAAVVVGLETSENLMARYGWLLHSFDKIILGIFTLEAAVKILAEWPRPLRYFRNGWNVFDFTIVAVCYVPAAGPWVAVVRLARILRAIRLVSQVPRLQVLVNALLKSLPSMFYVTILLGLHFYVYAVMGTFFFRENDPWHFGSLGQSLLTLFRVVTLEDWTDVMYVNMYGSDAYPITGMDGPAADPQAFGFWAVLYFVSFVAVGALVMINLFVGVMVTSISEAQGDQLQDSLGVSELQQQEKALEVSLERMEKELTELRRLIRRD